MNVTLVDALAPKDYVEAITAMSQLPAEIYTSFTHQKIYSRYSACNPMFPFKEHLHK